MPLLDMFFEGTKKSSGVMNCKTSNRFHLLVPRAWVSLALAVVYWMTVILLVLVGKPFRLPYLFTFHDRLVFGLRWQLLPMSTVLPFLLSSPSSQSALLQQENVCQVLFSSLGQLVFITYVEEDLLMLIPVMCGNFVVGRTVEWTALYWNCNVIWRRFGHYIVVMPSFAVLCYSLFCFVCQGAFVNLGRPTY